jgi:signal transduction histidine kinase
MDDTRIRILNYLKKIFPIDDELSGALDQKRKLIMLYIISVVAVATLVPLGIVALIQHNKMLGLFDQFVALSLAINLYYIIKSGKIEVPSIIGVTIAGALFVYLFATGGVDSTGHLWYYTFPLFSAFLLGFKGGAIATGILFAIAIGFIAISPQNSEFFTTYEKEFVIRFIPSFLVVFAFAYTFEILRKNAHDTLTSKNTALEQAVASLKEKEQALEKAHATLERRVEERTADLVRINAELQASHERFTSVLDSIPAHIYVANMATDEILFINKHMQDKYGLDCIGQPCWKALRAQNKRCQLCPNPKLLDAAGRPTGVYTWEDFNAAHQKWYLNNDRAINWVDSRLARLQISIDVTERKKAENALQDINDKLEQRVAERTAELARKNELLNHEVAVRQQAELEIRRAKEDADTANRAKSDFLANMSHELRTPLNHIIGFTEMIVDKRFGELNTRQQKHLNNVLQSGWHLLSLVNDILDLSKVEAGKLELERAPVNLKNLLQNSLVMVKEKAAKNGIRLWLNINGIPESITADERKLKQILYNLLSNAVKFTPDRGSVHCEARLANGNGNIEISVADTGIGIKPDDLKRIFDPFEQVDGSMSRRFEGTGLGLSLTKKLVELHGGRIWAESAGEGKGSRFMFTLPLLAIQNDINPCA